LQAGRGNRFLWTPLLNDVAAGTAGPWLFDRLLGAAFGADRGYLRQVIEACTAGSADTLGAEFGLCHPVASYAVPSWQERAPMPSWRATVKSFHRVLGGPLSREPTM